MKAGSRRIGILVVFVMAFTLLYSKDFWQQKSFLDWDTRETMTMLTRSAWASIVSVEAVESTGGTPSQKDPNAPCPCGCGKAPTFENVFGDGATIDAEVGKNPKRVRSAEEELRSASDRRLAVRFATARPVQMAMARSALLSGQISREQAQSLAVKGNLPPSIVVAVGSLDGRPWEADLATEDPKASVFLLLKRSGKQIGCERYLRPEQSGQPDSFFLFPRYDDARPVVTVEEKEISLVIRLRTGETIKAPFKLAKMLFEGELEI
jgi:hypothetical protein